MPREPTTLGRLAEEGSGRVGRRGESRRQTLLCLDVLPLDDGPPALGLGLVVDGERLWRLLLGRRHLDASSNSRCRTPWSASAPMTAALSLPTASFGVPFGAQNPNHMETCRPGNPASSTGGTVGAAARRCLSVTA